MTPEKREHVQQHMLPLLWPFLFAQFGILIEHRTCKESDRAEALPLRGGDKGENYFNEFLTRP